MSEIILKIFTIISISLIYLPTNLLMAMADPYLPVGVCQQIKIKDPVGYEDCEIATEKSTGASYIDLNDDGVKELIFIQGSHSCGSMYWIFELNKNIQWKYKGSFCGCEWTEEDRIPYKVVDSKRNGYKIIKTCGVSGFFNGKEYIGVMQ